MPTVRTRNALRMGHGKNNFKFSPGKQKPGLGAAGCAFEGQAGAVPENTQRTARKQRKRFLNCGWPVSTGSDALEAFAGHGVAFPDAEAPVSFGFAGSFNASFPVRKVPVAAHGACLAASSDVFPDFRDLDGARRRRWRRLVPGHPVSLGRRRAWTRSSP